MKAAVDLQSLLSQVRLRIQEKKTRKPTIVDASERHEWEWNNEYLLVGYVARFWHTSCECGSSQQGLEGVYEERRHLRLRSVVQKRMGAEKIRALNPALPRREEVRAEKVPVCIFCVSQEGFNTDEITRKALEDLCQGQRA